MEYDPERGDVVFYRKGGRIQVGWGVVAVFVFIAILVVGPWAFNCVGSEGRLEYRSSFIGMRLSLPLLKIDIVHGNSLGLMWLQEGQRVVVTYQAQGEDSQGKWDDSGGAYVKGFFQGNNRHYGDYAHVWFVPLEKWPAFKKLLEIKNGNGSADFVASKTGLYVLEYDLWRLDGNFTITWKVL